jgi:hypothetical protein
MDTDEDRTYKRLRQTPIEDMIVLMANVPRPSHLFNLAGNVFNRPEFYPEIQLYLERVKLIKDNGWEVEDFFIALEKRSVIEMVREYNEALVFPVDVIDRARKIFPNVKFTPASITLE